MNQKCIVVFCLKVVAIHCSLASSVKADSASDPAFDVTGSMFYVPEVSSARLKGSSYGRAIVSNDKLRTQVPFTVHSVSTDVEIRNIYLLRRSGESIAIAGVVRNTSQNTLCATRIRGFQLIGGKGNDPIGDFQKSINVTGVVGVDNEPSKTSFISYCLTSGALGYFVTSTNEKPDNIKSVSIDRLEVKPKLNHSVSKNPVVPIKYTDENDKFNLFVQNKGSSEAQLIRLTMIPLDEKGLPLGVLSHRFKARFPISAGKTASLNFGNIPLDGISSALRVITYYSTKD